MGGGAGYAWLDDGPHDVEVRRTTEQGEMDRLANWIAGQSQAGMRPHIKGSLLVTSGIIPAHIAAQTLVG